MGENKKETIGKADFFFHLGSFILIGGWGLGGRLVVIQVTK